MYLIAVKTDKTTGARVFPRLLWKRPPGFIGKKDKMVAVGHNHQLIMDNCRFSQSLGKGEGFKIAMMTLDLAVLVLEPWV